VTPDVTIVIPAWNAAHHIEKAIASALAQTGPSIEVVVADDASTDHTDAVVRALCDRRVRYLRLPINSGPSAARNAALSMARGAWTAVLDADDTMLPGRLEQLIGAAETNGLDIVADNMWVETESGPRRLFIDEELDGNIQQFGLREYVLRNLMFARGRGDGYLKPVFSMAFLRRHGLRYDPTMRIGEDFLLMIEALVCGAHYGRQHSVGFVYAAQAGSISHRLTGSHAQSMIGADLRFLTRYAARLKSEERSAMQAHLLHLRDGASFIAMVDAIKAGNIRALVREMLWRPAAIRHFRMPIAARLARLRLAI
jgi:succinoglycan biosynthesis protein ExoO